MWTGVQKCQNRREGLAYRRLASSASCSIRRVQIGNITKSNKHVVAKPRDPSSPPCEKAIPKLTFKVQVSSSSYSRSGYNTECPVTMDMAIQIDNFPAGVHYCYPTHSINSGRTHFSRSCLASADRHTAARPRAKQRGPRRSTS